MMPLALLLAACLVATPRTLQVRVESTRLRVHEPFEVSCDLVPPMGDQLNHDAPRLWAHITGPDGERTVPGYLDLPFSSHLDWLPNGELAEVFEPRSPVVWRVRFTPLVAGEHTLSLEAQLATGSLRSEPLTLLARTAKAPGFARLPADGWPCRQGAPPQPWLGANLAWAGSEGTFLVDGLLRKLGGARANLVRLWLQSPTRTFDLLDPTTGALVATHAARLETVLERARLQRLQVVLVLSAAEFAPRGYFVDAGWRQRSLRLVEYLVARYGADPNLVAWELCADATAAEPGLAAWCGDVAAELDRLDPHHRPTGISVAAGDAVALELFRALPDLDYVGLNLDWQPDPVAAVREALLPGAPALLISSYGAGAERLPAREAAAAQLNDLLWAGLFCGRTGAALPWRWETWLRRLDLFDRFAAVAEFESAVDWENLTPGELEPAPGWHGYQLSGPDAWLAWLRPEPGAAPLGQVTITAPPNGASQAGTFDPWTGEWCLVRPRGLSGGAAQIAVPPSERDIAVLLRKPRKRR